MHSYVKNTGTQLALLAGHKILKTADSLKESSVAWLREMAKLKPCFTTAIGFQIQ